MDGFRRRAKNKFGHSGWIMEFDAVSKKQYIFNHLSQSLSSSPPPGAATATAGAAAAPSAAAPAAAPAAAAAGGAAGKKSARDLRENSHMDVGE